MLDSSGVVGGQGARAIAHPHTPVPFSSPDISDAEILAVVEVLRSGWITSGPQMRAFEDEFAQYVGGGVEAIAVNSATAGLHLALDACGVGPGDEVIVPTWTFTATAEAVTYVGAVPVLVDVDPSTLLLDLDAVARALSPRTKAVMPVHVAGCSADIRELRDVVGPDVRIIEDAAHALPSCRAGVTVGSCRFSDAAVFSFYANKTMTTGEGGMITMGSRTMAERARMMRLHGIDRDAFARYSSTTGTWAYDVVHAGMKYNMADIAAALGRAQLRRCDEMADRRRRIAERYLEEFRDLPLGLPAPVAGCDVHAWHLFIVRTGLAGSLDRRRFMWELERRGVGTSVHFIPLHRLSYWRQSLGVTDGDLPVASKVFDEVVSLPIYSGMTDAQVDAVVAAVRAAYDGA